MGQSSQARVVAFKLTSDEDQVVFNGAVTPRRRFFEGPAREEGGRWGLLPHRVHRGVATFLR